MKHLTIISGERVEESDKRGKTTVAEKHKLSRKHKQTTAKGENCEFPTYASENNKQMKIVNSPLMHLKTINK